MDSCIVDYQVDEYGDWVAVLECGHFQHVRDKPPFINRPWVRTEKGRAQMVGSVLCCVKCDESAPQDIKTE